MADNNAPEKKSTPKFERTWVKTPTVYQMEATECGAASLAMIFGYFGRHFPLEQMRIETGVSRDGCNAKNIMRAGKKYGLLVRGFSRGVEGLLKLKPPCIIHWNFNHFVVFEGHKNGWFYINDPASGRRKLSYDELSDAFTGVVLTFEKGENFETGKPPKGLNNFIKDRLEGQYASLAALVAIGLLLVFPGLVIPVFSQVFVDDIIMGGNTDWVAGLLIAMVGTIIFQFALTLWRGLLLQKLQNKLALTSAHSFLSHMFRLPIGFFDQRYAGDLAQRVENNNNISNFLAGDLAETAMDIFVACFYLVLMLIYSPLLTFIGVLCVSLTLIMAKFGGDYLSNASMKVQQDQGKMVGTLYAGLSITDTLKASGSENEYIARVLGYFAKNITTEQKMNKVQKILQAVPEVLSEASRILVLMAGGVQVINGKMTPGMLLAFNSLLLSFNAPVNKLVGFIQRIQTLKSDMNRVEDIRKYEQDAKFAPTDEVPLENKLSGEVVLDNIAFGYSHLKPALIENFSFSLDSGSSIAFVGASGCGKSTVSKIISGLYTPWEGELLFDGIPLKKIPQRILCSSVSTVSQNITLFSGTIRDNLTLWNKGIMEQDIIQAAKDACIHDFITGLPGAYDFKLSEGGGNLSGGQRQRLEIARALVTNPTILIMDEATSALDPVVEKEIVDNIKRRGCTCIIVAHRLSAIRDCDQIIVMSQGKIVQHGTHDELREQQGHYQRLIQNI